MRFIRRALEVVLLTYVLGVLALAIAANAAPAAGYGLYAVRSESMAPSMAIGDLAVVRSVPATSIASGDVITIVIGAGATVTHRVVGVQPTDAGRVFRTKGDANATADPVAVRAEQLRGLVTSRLPMLGYLLAMLSMPSGIAALFSIGATLLTAVWLLDEVEAGDDEDELEEIERRLQLESAARLS